MVQPPQEIGLPLFLERSPFRAVIPRPELTARLLNAMSARVALISAPAGYGKTTLLNEAQERTELRMIRCDLNSDINTLARFVRELSDAVAPVAPGARLSFAGAYERAVQSQKPEQSLAAWFCEHLKGCRFTLAIDQLHYVRDIEPVAHFLIDAVEGSHEGIHWVFVSRGDIGLPLPRWMAERVMEMPIDAHALVFQAGDVERASAITNASLPRAQLRSIYDGTGGWPAGVMFALRGRDDRSGREQLRASTESHALLSKRLFEECSEREQEFLLSTSMLPYLDGRICTAAGWTDAGALLSRMGNDVASIFIDVRGELQYHDAFASYLQDRLRERGSIAFGAVLQIAASALEECGAVAEALSLYARYPVNAEVARLLTAHGLTLLEQGHADVVQAALRALDPASYESNGVILAIKATLETRAGRFDTFNALFTRAIELCAEPQLAAEITYLFACELIHQRHAGYCVELLTTLCAAEYLPGALRASVLSALAEAYFLLGDRTRANIEIEAAVGMTAAIGKPEIVSRVYARAAYIALYSNSHVRARQWARAALDLAKECGQFHIAAAACSVLFVSAVDIDDDLPQCLRYLQELAENGLKSGNPKLELYALVNSYELQVERADAEAMGTLGKALQSFDVHYGALEALESLLPSEALRATWDGGFLQAYRLLSASAEGQESAERRGLRFSEIALYAAAAGLTDESKSAARSAHRELADAVPSLRTFRARLLLAVCARIDGDEDSARAIFEELELGVPTSRSGALLRAFRETGSAQLKAIDALAGFDAEGIAKMLRALPARVPRRVEVRSLEPVGLTAAALPDFEMPILDEIDALINDMIATLERENPLMAEHSRAVSAWCARMARRLGLSASEVRLAARSGLVHDIGKVETPPEILNAPRVLDAREWKIMRLHTVSGAQMVEAVPALQHLVPAVRSHHERLDGRGYPDGLKGDQVPFVARLVCVADCFNAMIGRRPYRTPMLPSDALSELERGKGTQFDPELVDAMVAIVEGRR